MDNILWHFEMMIYFILASLFFVFGGGFLALLYFVKKYGVEFVENEVDRTENI